MLVEICEEGVPQEGVWAARPLKAKERYEIDAFGFSRFPHKYIDTGIRANRPNPFLLRAVAQVKLPAGEHRILLRGRGGSRPLIDGDLVLKTPFPPGRGWAWHHPQRCARPGARLPLCAARQP